MAKKEEGEFNGLALIAGGILLVGMSIGGYWVGFIFDNRFGTRPFGAFAGLVVGTIIGFIYLYRAARRIFESQPIPTRGQQEAAEANWVKTEIPDSDREDNHE